MLCLIISTSATGPATFRGPGDLEGAWRMVEMRGEPVEGLGVEMIKILADGHFMFAFYDEASRRFFSAGGGDYSYRDGKYKETIHFHTIDPTLIGKTLKFEALISDEYWVHSGEIGDGDLRETFERVDGLARSDLNGAWELQTAQSERSYFSAAHSAQAVTWKLIADGRFQWATFDPGSGAFIASGGGHISSHPDGWIEEQLLFHSRDSLQVGQPLVMSGLPDNNRWATAVAQSRAQDGRTASWLWRRLR